MQVVLGGLGGLGVDPADGFLRGPGGGDVPVGVAGGQQPLQFLLSVLVESLVGAGE